MRQRDNREPAANGGSGSELELFKLEFEHLAQGYRHTYQTIWQAGSVFVAISAGLLVFGSSEALESTQTTLVVRLIWPLPFLFWWLGVFTPMDRYAKFRLQRLAELERRAKDHWRYEMQHFSEVDEAALPKRQKLISMRKLRVGYMVDVFGVLIVLAWLYLLLSPIFAGASVDRNGSDPRDEPQLHSDFDTRGEPPDARLHCGPSD